MELQVLLNKLSQIQATINVAKNQKNSFGNYNYRSCEDILQALQPYCEKMNVVILLTDEIKETLNYVYVEATAKIIDADTGQELSVKAQAGVQERKGMDLSQTFGASSSYARKYALNGLFKLDDNKDADTDAFTKTIKKAENKDFQIEEKVIDNVYSKPKNQAKNEPKSQVSDNDLPFPEIAKENIQISYLEKLQNMVVDRVKRLGRDETGAKVYFAKQYGKKLFEELTIDELSATINWLDDTIQKQQNRGV